MTQRFTLDRTSFEQVLCATSLIQQLHRQAARNSQEQADFNPISDFVQAQEAIQNETMDFHSALARIAELALNLGCAAGSAVWLREHGQLICRASAGAPCSDENFASQVRARLASIEHPDASGAISGPASDCRVSLDAMHFPGSIKSLLVAPVYDGKIVAGALSVFSPRFDAFTESDATKARLLAGLLTYALGRTSQVNLQQSVTVERAAMRRAIDQLIPALVEMVEKRESATLSRHLLSAITDLQPPSGTAETPQQLSLPGVDTEFDPADDLLSDPGLRIVEAVAPAFQASPATAELPSAAIEPPTQTTGIAVEQGESLVEIATPQPIPTPLVADPVTAPLPSAAADQLSARATLSTRLAPLFERAAAISSTGMTLVATRSAAAFHLAATALRATRSQIARALAHGRVGLSEARAYRVRVRIPAELDRLQRVLSMSALPAAILSTIVVFLVLLMVGRNPSRTATSVSTGISAPPVVQASTSSALPTPNRALAPQPSAPATHLQITDASQAVALLSLSRYEVSGLRRQALFGDDSAAFLLGMAYETGRFVPQSCKKAAEWIARAAEAGNPAAAYNLGLRYRTGDGVAPDPQASAQWLKKAATRHYAKAQAALDAAE